MALPCAHMGSILGAPDASQRPDVPLGPAVRINDSAHDLVPDYGGMYGHVGIGGTAAAHYYRGDYFLNLRLHTGAPVILRLQ